MQVKLELVITSLGLCIAIETIIYKTPNDVPVGVSGTNSRSTFSARFAHSRGKQVSRETKCPALNARNTEIAPKNTSFSIVTRSLFP
jgi:hypothetical protein